MSEFDPEEVRLLLMQIKKERLQKNMAYSERNQCVALIARMALAMGWRAGVSQHALDDATWDPEWRTIVYVDLPTGQISWHLHDSEKHLLEGLPRYEEAWDGHTTDEKYRRIRVWRPPENARD